MSYKLEKPYTNTERADFVVEYNHKKGLCIEETEQALYALEANEMMAWVDIDEEIRVEVEPAVYKTVEVPAKYETIQKPVYNEEGFPILDEDGNQVLEEVQIEIEPARTEEMLVKEAVYETQTVTVKRYIPVINPNYEEEYTKAERERLAMLNMTGADVERAIYKVKGIDFDDILAMVKDNPSIDEKALKIEFKANNFFRGNPYIEQVGALLGFTSEMLNKFFETKDYIYLTTCKLTINATPTEATITGNGSYPYRTLIDYKVELDGYKPYIGSVELLEDTILDIELEKIEEVVDENTTDTTTDIPNEVGE